MEKTDKLFAALCVLSMAAFWVIIAPAGITAQISDAAPASISSGPTVAETKSTKAAPTRKTRTERSEKRPSAAQLARLKQRTKDTPMSAEEMRIRGVSPNVARPEAGQTGLIPRSEQPEYKQVY